MTETYDWDDPLPRPKWFDHFENNAENTVSGSGYAELNALHSQPSPLTALKNDCASKVISLADLPDPQPEGKNPAALFCNGWLRKGGGAFLVSTAGTGKSGVHQKTLNRLTDFIDNFKALNFAGDAELEQRLEEVRKAYLGTTAVEYRDNAGAQARMRQGIQKLAATARELAAADTREIVESFGKQGARRFTLAA